MNRNDPSGFKDVGTGHHPFCATADLCGGLFGDDDDDDDDDGGGGGGGGGQPGGGGGGGGNPLECFFTGFLTGPTIHGIASNTSGFSGQAFTDPVSLLFQATGGDGAYIWNFQQSVSDVLTTVTNGQSTVETDNTTEYVENTSDTPFGPYATFYDAPGLIYASSNGTISGNWSTKLLQQTFTDVVTVTDGLGQVADCPTVTWYNAVAVTRVRRRSGVIGFGQASLISPMPTLPPE